MRTIISPTISWISLAKVIFGKFSFLNHLSGCPDITPRNPSQVTSTAAMVWPHSSRCLVPRALRSDEQGYPSMGPECSTPDGSNGSCGTQLRSRWVVESDYSLKFLAPECVMVPKAVGFQFWDTLLHSNVAMEIHGNTSANTAADFPLPLPEGTTHFTIHLGSSSSRNNLTRVDLIPRTTWSSGAAKILYLYESCLTLTLISSPIQPPSHLKACYDIIKKNLQDIRCAWCGIPSKYKNLYFHAKIGAS